MQTRVIFFLSPDDQQNTFRLLLARVPQVGEIMKVKTRSGKTFKMEVVRITPCVGVDGESYEVLVKNPPGIRQDQQDFMYGWENMKVNHQSY